MNIGLYFGSFNPIHYGHLILAQTMLNETPLNALWFIVSPQNPFKKKQNLLNEYDRLRMVELALEDDDQMLASNVEFSLPRPSYTIDTLTHLADQYRSYQFNLIMGADNLKHLPKWKNSQTILKYYHIYAYPRSTAASSSLDDHPSVKIVEAPLLNISATYIRKCIQEKKSIKYLMPESVRNYISQNRLYEV